MARNKRMFGQYESEDIGDSERRCVFCGEVKSITDFPKNGRNPDGTTAYRLDCKVCYNIRRKENKTKKRHSDFIGGQKRRGEAEPRLSHQEWKEAVIFFKGACAYCGGTPRKNQRLTRDHLEPISIGGLTTQANIIPACSSCNSSKGAEEWRTWFMKQPFFSQDRMNKIFEWRSIIKACGDAYD